MFLLQVYQVLQTPVTLLPSPSTHMTQVYGRLVFPGAAMFEAARAAGASLDMQSLLPDAALQEAAIPAPLMLQKPQVNADEPQLLAACL